MQPSRIATRMAVAGMLFGALPATPSEARYFIDYPESAEAHIEGCRHIIGSADWSLRVDTNRCIGIIEGMAWVSPRICAPRDTTIRQMQIAIVAFLELRPNRLRESFKALAHEALYTTWPCSKP